MPLLRPLESNNIIGYERVTGLFWMKPCVKMHTSHEVMLWHIIDMGISWHQGVVFA